MEGRNLRCRSSKKEIQQYLDTDIMALTNRALDLGDFHPWKSSAGFLIPAPPGSKAASLCHYYQGTKTSVVGKGTLLTLPTSFASKKSRWTLGRPWSDANNSLKDWIILPVLYFHLFWEIMETIWTTLARWMRVKALMWLLYLWKIVCQRLYFFLLLIIS